MNMYGIEETLMEADMKDKEFRRSAVMRIAKERLIIQARTQEIQQE